MRRGLNRVPPSLLVAFLGAGDAQGVDRTELQPTRVDGLIAASAIAVAAVVAAAQPV